MRSLLFAALLLIPVSAAHADLRALFEDEQTQGFPIIPEEVLRSAKNLHVVMVSGFLNGFAVFNFADNKESLERELGVGTITEINPSSLKSIEENAELLKQQLHDAYIKGGRKPLFVFGHSKGGAEVLRAMIKYPELISSGVVEKAVVVQSPLQGVDTANKVRLLVEGPVISWPGMSSMSSRETQRILKEPAEKLSDETRRTLNEHVFYVRSASWTRKKDGGSAKISARDVREEFLKLTDGLILTESEKLDAVGTDLGVVIATHQELTMGHPFDGPIGPMKRRAFMRALFRELYGKEKHPSFTIQCPVDLAHLDVKAPVEEAYQTMAPVLGRIHEDNIPENPNVE